jgi:methylated-DNA-[protein]-cysteine S-methyltransferase
VSTYKLIAQRLGSSKRARAVGNALAKNPFPLIVPCHRVIRTDRRLGGYQGGQEMKRTLLEMDGVSFETSGRVNSKRFFYATDKKISQ